MAHLRRPSPSDPPYHDMEDKGLPLESIAEHECVGGESVSSPGRVWGGAGEGGVDGEDCLARYVFRSESKCWELGC